MSPDPGPWQIENPQYFNMYNYALNNPVRFADEEGETPEDRVRKANELTTQNIQYVRGGHSEKTGLDCSGLVGVVWKSDPDSMMKVSWNGPANGATNEASQFKANGEWSSDINDAEPGDAIFFSDTKGTIVHTGIVVDIRDGKVYFVHAPRPGKKVQAFYIKIKDPRLKDLKFTGVGRSFERNRPNASSSYTSRWWGQSLYEWLWEFFQNKQSNQNQSSQKKKEKELEESVSTRYWF